MTLDVKKILFKPISPNVLGLFRVLFGLILFWQFFRLKPYVVTILAKQKFFLTYDFFHWVKIGSPEQMEMVFTVSYVLCFFLIIGLLTRIVTIGLFFLWTYVFLIDAGHYNNHYYLYSLLLFLLIFVQSDAAFSIKNSFTKPENKVTYIPYWNLFIFKFQMLVVYFYGGIAKLDYDWLRGYPMKYWLQNRVSNPWFNNLLSSDASALFFSYSGLIFDLSIGFLVWNKKTQKWALIPLFAFHISNHFLFSIGTFPWFSIISTILFFDLSFLTKKQEPIELSEFINKQYKKSIAVLVITYMAIQFVMPLRQFMAPGDPSWHGVGHKFSWRMMLTDKIGKVKMKVKLPNDPNEYGIQLEEYMCARQFRKITRSSKYLWKFAHYLKQTAKENGAPDIEVYASVQKSYNGRVFQQFIDSTYNLADMPYANVGVPAYVKPLNKALPNKENNLEISFDELN